MSSVVVSAPPGHSHGPSSYSHSAGQSPRHIQSRPHGIDRVPSQSVITARVVPQHSPAAVSALADNVSTLSISPRTPIPPQLQIRNQNQGIGGTTSAAAAVVRASSETDERSSANNDVVIHNGWLMKRGKRWTWARRWFVLRPAQLTCYKDESEYKAADIIPISDITTAAILADDKSDSKRKSHFAIFTPSRNYHLHASTPVEAEQWVTDIKTAVRLAEQQSEYLRRQSATIFRAPNFQGSAENARSSENLTDITPTAPQVSIVAASPSASHRTNENTETGGRASISDDHNHHAPSPVLHGHHQHQHQHHQQQRQQHHHLLPPQRLTSPVESDLPTSPTTMARSRSPEYSIHNGSTYEYSGAEDVGFSSGASDYGLPVSGPLRDPSQIQLPPPAQVGQPRTSTSTADSHVVHDLAQLEKDRVLESGYLLRLVKRYNQWRKKWVVLRKGSIAFYKSEDEYKPLKIVPLDHVIDVMEIDPMSRSKQYCLQIILPEKRLRLCANTEEDLTRWLVAIKAAVVRYNKHKENK
ncbi:hypothetical protein V1525DRAFT_427694 [Lipomyces kononenkoae]|uniref:Uncharacterized protein n=1 Tax=Lipomyces kononenkoae TaxID=34357 RepID=A0ACC3SVJ7_LIPKO